MRVLNRDDFMNMPRGTFFIKLTDYDKMLCVKADTLENDFVSLPLFEMWDEYGSIPWLLEAGVSFENNFDNYARDGCFDDKDMFLTLEKNDLVKLRELIDEAINVA